MKNNFRSMKTVFVLGFIMLISFPVLSQEKVGKQLIDKSIRKGNALLDDFSDKCARRTQKAGKRFERYERKMMKAAESKRLKSKGDSLSAAQDTAFKPKAREIIANEAQNLGKEPLLDSLRLISGFSGYAGLSPDRQLTGKTKESIDRAQQQLDITQRAKSELLQRKEYWKAQVKEHPEYGKWLTKMEKERYYYTAQINEYRKVLRDPATLDDKLMNTLRSDPRFSDFVATLPAKPQDPGKMQPRQLVQQMMQSQAAAIDSDPVQLIKDAQKKGSDLLGDLSNQASSFGNLDNATQVPKFTPNPYKTKSFWERINVGFDLQFDRSTRFYPASGVAGAQASFNFDQRFSAGVLANYRFGTGEIKRIRFSHAGAGYGAFANYKVWKGLGVQAGYERNRRAETEVNETRYAAEWSSSALAGLTWEYGIGKKLKGSVGVFFDALYKRHTPQTNAVLWRMGWKL